MGDLPRNSMKPSQYLVQLEDETKDVTLDDIKKEHLLKTIPPRIREIMGKAVDSKTAEEVAKMADAYFDNQGRPLEKSATSINNVVDCQTTAATSSSQQSFTTAYEDDSTDVNFVKKGGFKNFRQRSKSRPRFNNNNGRQNNSNSNAAASTPSSSTAAPRQQQQQQQQR